MKPNVKIYSKILQIYVIDLYYKYTSRKIKSQVFGRIFLHIFKKNQQSNKNKKRFSNLLIR